MSNFLSLSAPDASNKQSHASLNVRPRHHSSFIIWWCDHFFSLGWWASVCCPAQVKTVELKAMAQFKFLIHTSQNSIRYMMSENFPTSFRGSLSPCRRSRVSGDKTPDTAVKGPRAAPSEYMHHAAHDALNVSAQRTRTPLCIALWCDAHECNQKAKLHFNNMLAFRCALQGRIFCLTAVTRRSSYKKSTQFCISNWSVYL